MKENPLEVTGGPRRGLLPLAKCSGRDSFDAIVVGSRDAERLVRESLRLRSRGEEGMCRGLL
jgi:hypothetical protein